MNQEKNSQARRKPRALRTGDTLGIIAPSGSSKDTTQADRGADKLRELGFKVKVGRSCRMDRYGYLAASDEVRASDVNEFFADPEVDGIVCLKGGYGTPRILDRIDYAIVAANPKIFVGYSDITGLHLAFARYAGFPTFHGPMAASMLGNLDRQSADAWVHALKSTEALGLLAPIPVFSEGAPVAGGSGETPATDSPGCLVGGIARGTIIGGNLSLVAALTGTPYAVEPEGKLLLLEDVNEEPYRVDRTLTQLRLASVFDRCEGIILGGWTDCGPKDPDRSLSLLQVWKDVVGSAGKPTIHGFQAGHCVPTHTLPFGVEAVLDASSGTLEIIESAAGIP